MFIVSFRSFSLRRSDMFMLCPLKITSRSYRAPNPLGQRL
jgi:hypothetical protein